MAAGLAKPPQVKVEAGLMNLVSRSDDVVEVNAPPVQPGSQKLDQVADLCELRKATQMADVLLANEQLLNELLGA